MPNILDQLYVVSIQGCLRPSNNIFLQTYTILNVTYSILLLACTEKLGRIFLPTRFSSFLLYCCSSNLSPLLPNILCLQCQSSLKHSGFSLKILSKKKKKKQEICSSKERCTSCSFEKDRWWLQMKIIFPTFKNYEHCERSHRSIGSGVKLPEYWNEEPKVFSKLLRHEKRRSHHGLLRRNLSN